MTVEKVSGADFERDVEGAEGSVVVDFYADWCGPCRHVAPELEELAFKWDGTIRFVKVNIDESQQVAKKYGVLSIPTIILFVNGEVTARTLGARPADAIERELGLATRRVA